MNLPCRILKTVHLDALCSGCTSARSESQRITSCLHNLTALSVFSLECSQHLKPATPKPVNCRRPPVSPVLINQAPGPSLNREGYTETKLVNLPKRSKEPRLPQAAMPSQRLICMPMLGLVPVRRVGSLERCLMMASATAGHDDN